MKILKLIVRALADAGLRLESWSYAIDKKMKLGIWIRVKNLTTEFTENHGVRNETQNS